MPRESKLPKRLQPMLATLTDAPFDDPAWVFESKWDGFRMVASIEGGNITLYSRNGKIISDSYLPVARALEKVKADAVIEGDLPLPASSERLLGSNQSCSRAHDRRRCKCGKRSWQGIGLYGAPTGRARKIGSRLRAANLAGRDVLFLI
jgi:ATP dependent DNA ligase domain